MNLDLVVTARNGYNFLDWLSDVGGIQGMIISFLAVGLGILNFNYFENSIVERMFRVKAPDDPNAKIEQGFGFFSKKKEPKPLEIEATLF